MPTDALTATIWSALAAPWQDGTLLRAFLEVALVGAVGGVLGCWIVLYGLSYGAESLAHALFPGLVAAALLGVPIVIGGAAGLIVAAAAVAAAGRVPKNGGGHAVPVGGPAPFWPRVLLAPSPPLPPA